MANQLEHANIRVKNIDETIKFLTTSFPDFRVRGGRRDDEVNWVHIGTDETYLALNEDARTEVRQDPGLNHIGFVFDDADALRKRLEEAGYKECYIPRESHPHHKRTYFHDGNGMEWEFVQYFSDDPVERNDYSY